MRAFRDSFGLPCVSFVNGGGGGGRMVQMFWVNFQCLGVLLIWIIIGQGPTALEIGADGGCLDSFYFCSFSLSLGDGPI